MMQVDRLMYSIPEICRYKTQIAKTQIILGLSLRKNNYHIIRLKNKDYHQTKKWNTYTISRDCEIFEHYSPKYHTDYLGIKEVDKKSISVVLENMGCLFKAPKNKYINWLNEECSADLVVEKKWLGYLYWEKITDEQLQATADLCASLCDEFNIPKKVIDFHHHNSDTVNYKGIVFKSNYIADSSDISPMFDIERFREMLDNSNQ